jgi:DNA-binding MarR family transcriptional regulator
VTTPVSTTTPPDPVIEEIRTLTGRTSLSADDAHRRLVLLVQLLNRGGRTLTEIAAQIGCSGSNLSRLVQLAQQRIEGTQT